MLYWWVLFRSRFEGHTRAACDDEAEESEKESEEEAEHGDSKESDGMREADQGEQDNLLDLIQAANKVFEGKEEGAEEDKTEDIEAGAPWLVEACFIQRRKLFVFEDKEDVCSKLTIQAITRTQARKESYPNLPHLERQAELLDMNNVEDKEWMSQRERELLWKMFKLMTDLESEDIVTCPRLRWDGKSGDDEKTLIRRFGFLINAYHVGTLSFPHLYSFSLALSLFRSHALFLFSNSLPLLFFLPHQRALSPLP